VKFIVENWYLFVMAIGSGAMLLVPMLRGGNAGLAPAGAVQLVNREKAVLIDVCGADEYAAGHAVCAQSPPRAQRAAAIARKLGYANVQVLAGGLKAWREASLPVEKA